MVGAALHVSSTPEQPEGRGLGGAQEGRYPGPHPGLQSHEPGPRPRRGPPSSSYPAAGQGTVRPLGKGEARRRSTLSSTEPGKPTLALPLPGCLGASVSPLVLHSWY